MYLGLQTKHLLFLSSFNQNQKVPTNFSKNSKYEISRKFDQWESRWSLRKHTWRRQPLFAFRSAWKKLPVFMSETVGSFPREVNISRDFEGEYVAISRPKCEEVIAAWGKLHIKELHNLFLSAKYCQGNEH